VFYALNLFKNAFFDDDVDYSKRFSSFLGFFATIQVIQVDFNNFQSFDTYEFSTGFVQNGFMPDQHQVVCSFESEDFGPIKESRRRRV
jgi:hypothetical protein